jgi:hypothetical protein
MVFQKSWCSTMLVINQLILIDFIPKYKVMGIGKNDKDVED